MHQTLGLDEALVTVNKSSISESLEVYYQNNECFGCPLDRLRTLSAQVEDFVIGTKFNLQLELRSSIGRGNGCRFETLSLNSHAHYKIDVSSNKTSDGDLNCSFKTLDEGDCLWCPIAILICLLLVLTATEKLYVRLVQRKRPRKTSLDSRVGAIQSQERVVNQDEAHEHLEDEANSEMSARGSKVTQAAKRRVESLDAFRGLTIAGMIFVNYGGAGYTFLEHKTWDGITFADFVFPFFIFSMGCSIAISIRSMFMDDKSLGQVSLKILRRSFILMAIGLCLNSKWLNGASLAHLRLTGVLQRFSISYLVVSLMYAVEMTFNKWIKTQSLYRAPLLSSFLSVMFEFLAAFNFLAIYVYLTFFFQYSDECPAGYTGPGGQTEGGRYLNCTGGAAAWLDRLVLGEQHLYKDTSLKAIFKATASHDPEGLLGCTTSVLLTLIGLQCGKILVRFRNSKTRLLLLSQWIALLSLACVAVIIIPINKKLWSLTFITITGASAYLVITLLYLVIDVYQCQTTFLLRLMISAGKNPIFLYVGHSLLTNMLPWHFNVDESSHLQLLLRLVWSVFVWLLVAHYMALKGLFIKV